MKRLLIYILMCIFSGLFAQAQGLYLHKNNGTSQLIKSSEMDSVINNPTAKTLRFVKNGKEVLLVPKEDVKDISFMDSTELKNDLVAVDLGLPSGTKWASQNIGAINPLQQGYLFAWGETDSKLTYSQSNYKYSYGSSIKEYPQSTLLPEDDAATSILGGDWQIPTLKQALELLKYCTISTVTYYDKNDNPYTFYYVAGPRNGIILSGESLCWLKNVADSTNAKSWSPSMNVYNTSNQVKVNGSEIGNKNRYEGYPIRPVLGNAVSPLVGDTVIKVTGENLLVNASDVGSTGWWQYKRVEVVDSLINPAIEGEINGNYYVSISPTASVNSKMTVSFNLGNLNLDGGTYDIYMTFVPENYLDKTNTNSKYNVFTATLIPYFNYRSSTRVYPQESKTVGTTSNYLKTDPTKIDSVLLFEDYKFPDNVLLYPVLNISSVISSRLSKVATGIMNFDSIILKRKD